MSSNQNSIQNKMHNKSRGFLALCVLPLGTSLQPSPVTLNSQLSPTVPSNTTRSPPLSFENIVCYEWQCLLLFLFCFVYTNFSALKETLV